MGMKMAAMGHYKPKVKVTNKVWKENFAPKIEIASHEFTRTISQGVECRYYAAPEETVVSMAQEAINNCLANAPIAAEEIDLLVHSSIVPDKVEGDVDEIRETIGADNAFTYEITDVACAGAVVALQQIAAFIETGTYRNVLLCCVSTTASRGGNMADMFGCAIGDLATAVLLTPSEDSNQGFQHFCHRTFGQYSEVFEFIPVKNGVMVWPEEHQDKYWANKFHILRPRWLKEIHTVNTDFFKKVVAESLESAGLTPENIDWLITHQPGGLLEEWRNLLGFPEEKHLDTFKEIGNCGNCNIPYTIMRAVEDNKIQRGDKILIVGIGRGIHIVSGIWSW